MRIRLPGTIRVGETTALRVGERSFDVHTVSAGVPHAVIFVENPVAMDLRYFGGMIRRHRHFTPAGTNVDFVQVLDRNTLVLRTFERGVEDETLACGSGAASAQSVARSLGYTGDSVTVRTASGQNLAVLCREDEVFLQGPAVFTCRGNSIFPPWTEAESPLFSG